MDAQQTQEIPHKEQRGRPGKTVHLSVELPMADAQEALSLTGRRMRQLGEFVSLDRVLSEAIQAYAKALKSEAAS